jgi:hypothetical protein
VESEDIPEGVRAEVPGVEHMTELNLEPIGAPRAAYAWLRRVAKAIASSGHGAIVDVQTDAITTPAGVHRLAAQRSSAALDALELSWFSADESLRSRAWLEEFVQALEHELPQALPVRYGPYEPPPYRFRETGREHLIDFLVDEYLNPSNGGLAVWYPKRPVLTVTLCLDCGPSRHGWRAHRLTVDVEAAVLEQPGWPTALQRLWRRIAHSSRAFFADVRTLRNYRPGGATFDELMAADRHPVCGWFWAGIPRDGGHAVALGQPYLTLWPQFEKLGERDGGLVFLSNDNWIQSADVFARVGGVPEALAVQCSAYAHDTFGPNLDRVYPPVWPFGMTHADLQR